MHLCMHMYTHPNAYIHIHTPFLNIIISQATEKASKRSKASVRRHEALGRILKGKGP